MPALKQHPPKSKSIPVDAVDPIVLEILVELDSIGAVDIAVAQQGDRIRGLTWALRLSNRARMQFVAMPRVEPVYQDLVRRRLCVSDRFNTAYTYAWRHFHRWIKAQVAMIETGMLEPAEPFVAFAVFSDTGCSLFDTLADLVKKGPPPAEPAA